MDGKIKVTRLFLWLIALVFFSGTLFPQGIIIDHNSADVSKIPDYWINQIRSSLKLHYAHTSHGGQLTEGIARLANPALPVYDPRLTYAIENKALPVSSNLCIMNGQLEMTYIEAEDYWQAGGDLLTRASLNTYPALNVSMWAFCTQLNYQTVAFVNEYLNMMSQLELDYPQVTFVYMTGNAQSNGSDGYNRYLRNEQIRNYCRNNNKVLFDFADLDAWYNGEQATYLYNGQNIPVEHPQYFGEESSHTTFLSCETKGQALWWLLARILGWEGPDSQINASANASSTSGSAPLTTSFTGSASGGTPPYTYSWNFGDGGTSTAQNPSHTYSISGNFSAILTVTDNNDNEGTDGITINVSDQTHEVTVPNTPSGPASGDINSSLTYSTGGATCSLGHNVQYRFEWGDGQASVWSSSTSASHAFANPGTYTVKARARCANDINIVSSYYSYGVDVVISASHNVSSPNTPSGPSSGNVNTSLTYSTGGATCSLGHSVQYRFEWGDGTSSTWSNSTSASHSFASPGTYTVRARARCANDISLVSNWSTGKAVVITAVHSVSTPNTPSGPSSGGLNTSLTYSTGGATCSLGHSVQYRFEWGDGTSSTWSNSTGASHSFANPGTYTVRARARCANDISLVSNLSAGINVTISVTTQHTVSVPIIPSGPSDGNPNTSYSFSTGGAACSEGHAVEYRFDWGDGSYSVWSSSANAAHSWASTGTYRVKAQARCAVNHTIYSVKSAENSVSISTAQHTVTPPVSPAGPGSGSPDAAYTFSSGASICTLGHSVEYRYDWGDGSYSAWTSSPNASHSWAAIGSYTIKVRSRCSVDTSILSSWSNGFTIQISTNTPTYSLSLSAQTSATVPGDGGSLNPQAGNHSFPSGSTIQLSASPFQNYRFSKWEGNVSSSKAFDKDINLYIDQNKSVTAKFFTQCGDVNGDLSLSPTDAQQAFDIFLGKITNPTEAQKENADVNCDGTKTTPNVTPQDAHAIFMKFLGKKELPGDCSCNSRADDVATASVQRYSGLEHVLRIDDMVGVLGQQILVPVMIENLYNVKSFGFDIVFPSGQLEFVGAARTELTNDFIQLDALELSEGRVRAGGYSNEPILQLSSGTLIILIFEVKTSSPEGSLLLITNTVDDLEGTQVIPGRIFTQNFSRQDPKSKDRDPGFLKK